MSKLSLPFSPLHNNSSVVTLPSKKAQPSDVRYAHLSRTARQVYWALCNYRDAENIAFPSVSTLAAECGISRRAVQNGLAELKACRRICAFNGNRGGGSYEGTRYHLHPAGIPCERCRAAQASADVARGAIPAPPRRPAGVQNSTSRGAENDSAIRKNPPNEPSIGLVDSDPAFLEWWVSYTSSTGVPVNGSDQAQAEREWSRLPLAERIAAVRFLPQVPDGRPANRYLLPKNFLANRIWTRQSIVKERPEPRGLKAGEIE